MNYFCLDRYQFFFIVHKVYRLQVKLSKISENVLQGFIFTYIRQKVGIRMKVDPDPLWIPAESCIGT